MLGLLLGHLHEPHNDDRERPERRVKNQQLLTAARVPPGKRSHVRHSRRTRPAWGQARSGGRPVQGSSPGSPFTDTKVEWARVKLLEGPEAGTERLVRSTELSPDSEDGLAPLPLSTMGGASAPFRLAVDAYAEAHDVSRAETFRRIAAETGNSPKGLALRDLDPGESMWDVSAPF